MTIIIPEKFAPIVFNCPYCKREFKNYKFVLVSGEYRHERCGTAFRVVDETMKTEIV